MHREAKIQRGIIQKLVGIQGWTGEDPYGKLGQVKQVTGRISSRL